MKETAPFQLDLLLDGKATLAEAQNDGLWIEGWASDFDVDRQDEAFLPGAFDKGLKSFLETQPSLFYHHQYDKVVGQVMDAKLVDGKGLFIKARIDPAEPGTEKANIYNQVAAKTIRGLSVGGVFKRKQTPQGPRIHEVDLRDISITALPVNPRSLFELAGKAFGTEPDLEQCLADIAMLIDEQATAAARL